jgi:hypothetical protein
MDPAPDPAIDLEDANKKLLFSSFSAYYRIRIQRPKNLWIRILNTGSLLTYFGHGLQQTKHEILIFKQTVKNLPVVAPNLPCSVKNLADFFVKMHKRNCFNPGLKSYICT